MESKLNFLDIFNSDNIFLILYFEMKDIYYQCQLFEFLIQTLLKKYSFKIFGFTKIPTDLDRIRSFKNVICTIMPVFNGIAGIITMTHQNPKFFLLFY